MLLSEALDRAADRAATDDPRFPPISPTELDQLDMHVWLLWGPQPVAARGEDRVNAVVIGKHGVQIGRGGARGLLLPSVALDYGLDARGFLQQVCLKAGLPKDAWKDDDTILLVFEGYAVEGPLELTAEGAPELEQPDVRPPAVAGGFYPGTAREIQRRLEEMFAEAPKNPPEPWAGALVPHAGWDYSGRLAAAVFQRVQLPECVVMLCPKHRPGGTPWAVAPHTRWAFPGGEVASDPAMATRLANAVTGLTLDAEAHSQEHAIEVHLPLLARLAPQVRVVGIVVGDRLLPELLRFGRQLADALRDLPERPLLVVSSDMNHFADDAETRRLDQLALDAIQTLDPVQVYETVKEKRISMCGAAPCTVVMEALRRLNALQRCELVGHITSAERTGNTQHVVGYAGLLFG
jgi:AmmeMemoRadiSam system protein B